MKSSHLNNIIGVLLTAFVLVACGGGGGGMTAGGGTGGTGIISSGTISAFGSIFVNGTEFDTRDATVIINGDDKGVGDAIVAANLDVGLVVTVEGRIDQDGNILADRILHSTNVIGPLESIGDIDPATKEKEIVVLGQPVIVNVITVFKNTGLDDLSVDDVVSVSGYLDDNDVIRATFLEKTGNISSVSEYEVTGFVENLDAVNSTFTINSLVVDYSSIAGSLPPGIPAVGLFIEITGILDVAGRVMSAKSIELGDELGGQDGDSLEIMGFVTTVASAFEFTIGNQAVKFDENTDFVDGLPTDIAPGIKLEAEGSLADGVLVADEIEFWGPDQVEVEGLVSDIHSLTEFTVSGQDGDQVVQTDDETVFEDVEPGEIEVGMKIEVKGVPVDIDHSVLTADKVSFEID